MNSGCINLDYLKNEIIPQREKEIQGKNGFTRQPIYIVYDVVESVTTRDDEYSNLENCNLHWYKSKSWRFVSYDEDWNIIEADEDWFDSEDCEFVEWDWDISVFYIDIFIAIFLTRKWAEEYLKYQSHNLTDKAYIYTHYSWYANQEMNNLL